jgi:2-oxoglutarate ferredoxin oxidoreductase subunit alpha
MGKILMKGNEAIGAAAIKAGCKFFFGYPITPQSELPEYMSREMPKAGATFLQAESEIAAINMVYGAAGAGARVMTSSSSPGISLKMEGISYLAGSELPCLIVNIVRGGPGLGGIQPAQSDYFQATKGGGHGDYRMIVLAPESVQELIDLIVEGFDLADKYRNPVMVMGDGMLGQMMEPVDLDRPVNKDLPPKDWATTGTAGRNYRNVINSLFIDPAECEKHNMKLKAKYDSMVENEKKYEIFNCDNPDIIAVAYGTTARIVKTVIDRCQNEGIKVGLIRPITLWPFPYEVFEEYADRTKAFLSVEMSTGQMVEDVKLGANGKKPVYFYGRTGGMVPTPDGIIAEIKKILGGAK